ncbi:MAG TPA: hypothetical protein VG326_16780 [Tepidisphaeraceae bacterium]|nr:hypothetical protein [Tepidisphaeraceae bacterium]
MRPTVLWKMLTTPGDKDVDDVRVACGSGLAVIVGFSIILS